MLVNVHHASINSGQIFWIKSQNMQDFLCDSFNTHRYTNFFFQVASRVQKYFIKLAKSGLPVPGRMPNLPRTGMRVCMVGGVVLF